MDCLGQDDLGWKSLPVNILQVYSTGLQQTVFFGGWLSFTPQGSVKATPSCLAHRQLQLEQSHADVCLLEAGLLAGWRAACLAPLIWQQQPWMSHQTACVRW